MSDFYKDMYNYEKIEELVQESIKIHKAESVALKGGVSYTLKTLFDFTSDSDVIPIAFDTSRVTGQALTYLGNPYITVSYGGTGTQKNVNFVTVNSDSVLKVVNQLPSSIDVFNAKITMYYILKNEI